MKNLLVRSITGAPFVGLIVGSVLWDEIIATLVLYTFFTLAAIEYFMLFKGNSVIQISWRIGLVITLVPFALLSAIQHGFLPAYTSLLLIPFLFATIISELWRKKEQPLINIGIYLFAVFYLALPFFLMVRLNLSDYQFNGIAPEGPYIPILLGMFALVWTNDTFAYLTGLLFGKHKLIERISPKKTWEGTIGGIVFTLLTAYLIAVFTSPEDLVFWLVAGAIVGPCAILGDLLESLIKRSLSIKDTGSILPGHGGVLDRFDAAIFTVPFFIAWTYFYLYL